MNKMRICHRAVLGAMSVLFVACGGVPEQEESAGEGMSEDIGTASSALQNCLTIAATPSMPSAAQDTQILQAQPSTNYGSNVLMSVGQVNTSFEEQSLLRFDLSAIPANSLIVSALVHLKKPIASDTANIDVHRVSAPWSQATATWSNIAGSVDPTVWTTFHNGGGGTGIFSFDITNLVSSWVHGAFPNDGMVLSQHPTQQFSNTDQFFTSEMSSTAARPRLTVCYGPASCTNGVQDGPETGVDCGGPSCLPCPGTVPYVCDGSNYQSVEYADNTSINVSGPVFAYQWIPTVSDDITRLEFFTGESTGAAAVGIWSDDGSANGAPLAPLGYSQPFTMNQQNQWQGGVLNNVVSVVAGQKYWVLYDPPTGGSQSPDDFTGSDTQRYYVSYSATVSGGSGWQGPVAPSGHKFRVFCAP